MCPAGHAHNADRDFGEQARLLPPPGGDVQVIPRPRLSARRSALGVLTRWYPLPNSCPVAGLARSFIYRLPLVAAAVGAKVLRGCPLTSPVRARTISSGVGHWASGIAAPLPVAAARAGVLGLALEASITGPEPGI